MLLKFYRHHVVVRYVGEPTCLVAAPHGNRPYISTNPLLFNSIKEAVAATEDQTGPSKIYKVAIWSGSVSADVWMQARDTKQVQYREAWSCKTWWAVRLDRRHWQGTVDFLSPIIKLWKVLHVKTRSIGRHRRDYTIDPVHSSLHCKLQFLQEVTETLQLTRHCIVWLSGNASHIAIKNIINYQNFQKKYIG